MSPSELNAVARLVWIAERCGPEFLDNAESFDRLIGRGRFAETDSNVLDFARALSNPSLMASYSLGSVLLTSRKMFAKTT